MPRSLFDDAFAHNVWATARLIDACAPLTAGQLATAVPGTYGSIIETLRHLVESDSWYLSFFRDSGIERVDEDADVGLDRLRAAITANGALWDAVLAEGQDPDRRIEEVDDGWRIRSAVGVRLAQVVHHGTDHRSQVCTALTTLGIEPPEIDVWAYAQATGRLRQVPPPAETTPG
jgi:uncharacterized damage-inducible protein DinB